MADYFFATLLFTLLASYQVELGSYVHAATG